MALDDVSITDLTFGNESIAAIEVKQVATQEAERIKFVAEKVEQDKRSIIIRVEVSLLYLTWNLLSLVFEFANILTIQYKILLQIIFVVVDRFWLLFHWLVLLLELNYDLELICICIENIIYKCYSISYVIVCWDMWVISALCFWLIFFICKIKMKNYSSRLVLIDYLGTIAQSGTAKFLEALKRFNTLPIFV